MVYDVGLFINDLSYTKIFFISIEMENHFQNSQHLIITNTSWREMLNRNVLCILCAKITNKKKEQNKEEATNAINYFPGIIRTETKPKRIIKWRTANAFGGI